MSDIAKARSKLSSVSTLLKKKKFVVALMSIQDAIGLYLKTPLMRHEKRDFQKKLEDAIYLLKINKEFIQQYPLPIEYTPGEEKKLWEFLNQAIKELQSSTIDEAKKQLEELEKLKQRELEKGKNHLKAKEYDKAESIFKKLTTTFKEDIDLKLAISDMYMDEGLVEKALSYLKDAYKEDPEAIHLLNKMGITLRKAGKPELATKIFLEAVSKSPDDEYLLFNLGRTYIDEKKWDEVVEVSKKALELNPEFKEAKKMLRFAQKKLQ